MLEDTDSRELQEQPQGGDENSMRLVNIARPKSNSGKKSAKKTAIPPMPMTTPHGRLQHEGFNSAFVQLLANNIKLQTQPALTCGK